jgi:hypothetical protein
MSQRRRRLDPPQAHLAERQRPKERRRDCKGVNCRADIVPKAGERELSRSSAAADRLLGFKDGHTAARAGNFDRGRQPIRSAANHDRVDRP